MAGKNKIETGFRLWFDDSGGTARDLSGDLVPGSCKGGGLVLDEIDMTGESNTVKNALAGHGDGTVTAEIIANDTATTGSTTVLHGMVGSDGTLTLQWGSGGAAPAASDLEWEGEYVLMGAQLSFSGGRAVHSCTWKPAAGSAAPAWGTYS